MITKIRSFLAQKRKVKEAVSTCRREFLKRGLKQFI